MELIRNFSNLSKSDVSIAGGKGASLGEMINSGIPVPEGFVVLSTTFEKFIEETDLNIEIDAALDKVNTEDINSVEEASEKIQSLILSKEIPSDIKINIEKEFEELNCKFVAVRSSATSEDSASAAWAGQLDTFLNTTREDLLENVKRCWASLFTPRAIFYRFEQKLDQTKISVAVVVQKMVNSEESGIAFSVHPVTQDRNQIIIEAGLGLGEAIVSGQITPDSYVIDKQNWEILDINVSEQTKGLFRKSEGGNEWKDLEEKGKEQILNEEEIIELSKLIVKIENHYGFPCDIEWARENEKFYIVQSRPITTLGNLKTDKNKINKKKESLLDEFLKRTYIEKIWPPVTSSCIFVQSCTTWYKKYFDEIYNDRTNLDTLMINYKGKNWLYLDSMKIEKLSKEICEDYFNDQKKMNKILSDFDNAKEKIISLYNKISYENIKSLDEKELLKIANEIAENFVIIDTRGCFALGFDMDILEEVLKEYKINENISEDFFSKSQEISHLSFDKQQEVEYLNYLVKGLSHDEIIEKMQYAFSSYSSIKNPIEIEKIFHEKFEKYNNEEAKKRLKKIQEEYAQKKEKYDSWYKSLENTSLKKIADFIYKVIEIRDIRKNPMSMSYTALFRVLEELFERNSLNKKYILYVTFDELFKGSKYLIKKFEEIKKRGEGCILLIEYDEGEVLIEYGKEVFENTKIKLDKIYSREEKLEDITGVSGSFGKIKGKVRVIQFIEHQKDEFQKGEILVTGMTRPEFVPLMKKASAIVTDEGGITCHAAIISRELNKPCVIGTKIATQILKNGMEVEVDADEGIVRILEK